MLGGRVIMLRMEPLSSFEIGSAFNLKQALNWGQLPLVVNQIELASKTLQSYLQTYLKEEIAQEGFVRKLEPFARFVEISCIMNQQTLNYENLGRDARVKNSSVQNYFELLEDTLADHKLNAYRPAAKVRENSKTKFYFFDVGVARVAARYLQDELDPVYEGFLFETLLFHELRCFNEYSERHRPLAHYATPTGDIDFIIEANIGTVLLSEIFDRLKVLLKLKSQTKDGCLFWRKFIEHEDFTVYPVLMFLEALHAGKIY
jgi:predicted AAA+ superfamily ATPase